MTKNQDTGVTFRGVPIVRDDGSPLQVGDIVAGETFLVRAPIEFAAWRERMGMTQQDAARALGLHLRTAQRYDAGEATPHPITLACAYLELVRTLKGLLK
jgi:DNA-binding XRE family transcriptional regulator